MDCIQEKNAQGFCYNVDNCIDSCQDRDGIPAFVRAYNTFVDCMEYVTKLSHEHRNYRSGLALTNPEE